MKPFVIVIILTVISFPGRGQLDNRSLEWQRIRESADSGRFYAGFRTLGYLRNNEFFNDVLEGYTLFGYQVNPYLAWQAGKHVRIEGGVYISQAFGENEFEDILPTFSLIYRRNGHQMVFGTLQGSISHGLIEPLYDFENLLNGNRLEYGVQYRYLNSALFTDVWLEWRDAISPGDAGQEELVGGVSAEYKWINLPKAGFSTLLQAMLFHRGGQINESDLPLQTYFNGAFGLRGWVRPGALNLTADLYYVTFSDNSGTSLLPFDGGDGWYANVFIQAPFPVGLMISYWRSEAYYSPIGGRLYQNFSYLPESFGEEQNDRELLFFRFLYDAPLADGLQLGIRGEPYLDLGSGELEWSAGLYLTYQVEFALGKEK